MNSKLQLSQTYSLVVRGNPWRATVNIATLRCPLAMLLLLLQGAASLAAPAAAPREVRESAVKQARAGDPKGALRILQELVRAYPDDSQLLADTTIIANWAGDDSYALDLYGRLQTPKNDLGATEAAARAARNLHRYGEALELFRRAEDLAPDDWRPQLGYALVLTDQGNLSAAAEMMRPLAAKKGSEPNVERGEAYLCSRQQDYACATRVYEQLLAQLPENKGEIRCEMAQSVSQLGANTLAQGMCESGEPGEKLGLMAAAGAERVRWSETIDHDWQRRKGDAEQALAMLDGVIAASSSKNYLWKQAQSDRLLALYDLYRMQDVVQSWQHLRKLGVKVPDYALARVAGACLTLRHPQQAETLYRGLVERSPDDGDLWSGLVYAEFESEHIRQSFSTVDQAYGDTPAWLQSRSLKVPDPNELHASLALQAAQMRGYADMPAQEQKRLSTLLGMAPADPELGRAMAKTYLARGWPLLAMRQERIADSYEQKDDLPVLEDAEVLEGAGRREQADALLGPLLTREGRSPAVDRFLTERVAERGLQATVTAGYEWSSGRYLGNSQNSEAYLYSPLLNDRWRIYGHGFGETGQFIEGSAYRSRGAVGLKYDYSRQSFWGELAGDSGNAGSISAGAAGAQFSLGDHWVLGAEGDTDNLTDVQLIAELAGLRARSGSVHAEWRQSELSSIHFNGERMLFSDGNQRSIVAGEWDQRVFTAPRFQIGITPELWASANSKDQNRIYFNPSQDFSFGSSATANWVTWRHYDRSLLQRFTVFGAPYWEENYGTHGAFSGDYTQLWKVSRRLGLIGKFAWHGQPYDGIRQPYTDLSFGLTWGDQ
ncbi:MAG TPA: poly-beta-1,6 N-acetyl-D-glucosamine export porin PgaA [Terracidiphilus sp.]|nr:poly-beta-1,6 N-acetyl-D-glucosamine export porin PgaA [Terracidiphilus sp.]